MTIISFWLGKSHPFKYTRSKNKLTYAVLSLCVRLKWNEKNKKISARRSSDNPFGRQHRKLPPSNIPPKLNRNTHLVIIYLWIVYTVIFYFCVMQFRLYWWKQFAKIIFFPLDILKIFEAARRSSDNPFGRHHIKLFIQNWF